MAEEAPGTWYPCSWHSTPSCHAVLIPLEKGEQLSLQGSVLPPSIAGHFLLPPFISPPGPVMLKATGTAPVSKRCDWEPVLNKLADESATSENVRTTIQLRFSGRLWAFLQEAAGPWTGSLFPRALRMTQGAGWAGRSSVFAQKGAHRDTAYRAREWGATEAGKEQTCRNTRRDEDSDQREHARQRPGRLRDRQTEVSGGREGRGGRRERLENERRQHDMSCSHLPALPTPPSSEG